MGPFDRLSQDAKHVFALSQDEAVRLRHDHLGTEHLLLGLLRGGGGAGQVLEALGLELSGARAAVRSIIGPAEGTWPPPEIALTPRVRTVMGLAIRESTTLGHERVKPEHLLLGILDDAAGVAAHLIGSRAPLGAVREQVLAALGRPGGASP